MPYQVRADGSPILANAGQSSLLEELRQRIVAGDPAARDELLRLARSEHTGSGPVSGQTLEVGQARKLANELLGTDLADLERSGGWLNNFVANDLGDLLVGGAGAAIAAPVVAGALGSGGAGVAATGPGGLGGSATAAGGLGGAGGILGAAGGLKKAVGDYAPLVLGGVQALSGASQQGRADALQREALNYARNDYNSRAGFRDAASARLLGPQAQREDLSALYAPAQNNPYAVRRPPLAAPPPRPIDGAPLPPPQVVPTAGADFGRLPHAPRRV